MLYGLNKITHIGFSRIASDFFFQFAPTPQLILGVTQTTCCSLSMLSSSWGSLVLSPYLVNSCPFSEHNSSVASFLESSFTS